MATERDGMAITRRGALPAIAGVAALAAAPSRTLAATAGGEPRATLAQRRWGPPPPPIRVREGLAPVRGANLYYWDTGGDGEPIVLLHPATGSALVWGYQQPVFAAAGYRVIAYSRRGHARSEPGPRDDTGNPVDDLDALLDHLKVGRFHILGSAAGGFVVPDYALSHPDRLLSMTLACTQGGVIEPAYRERIAAVTPPAFQAMPPAMRELGPSYRAGYPPGVAAWEALEHNSQSTPERVRQAPKNRLLWEDLARIPTRALVMTGGADLYMPVPLMLEYASHLRNARTAVLSESGHSGYWEQPEAFNRLVLDFIRSGRR